MFKRRNDWACPQCDWPGHVHSVADHMNGQSAKRQVFKVLSTDMISLEKTNFLNGGGKD